MSLNLKNTEFERFSSEFLDNQDSDARKKNGVTIDYSLEVLCYPLRSWCKQPIL